MTRRASFVVLTFLAIELLDEFVAGAVGAAWPLIRTDLGLSYVQIGVLLSAPAVFAHLIEPTIGILGDVWNRRALVLGGGVAFGVALVFVAAAPGFLFLLAAFALLYPASGAFVSLSQASFMDSDTARREQNMARWTLAGAIGVVLGALALALSVAVGAGWRGLFLGLLAVTTVVLLMARRAPFGTTAAVDESAKRPDLKDGVTRAWRALRDRSILRWLVLYEFSDLMLDGLHGYIALYFVDVAKTSAAYAATAVAVGAGADLLGTLLLIPLLERVKGVSYLKISTLVALVLYAGFLLVPSPPMKLAALALLGVALAGWYSVLKAQVYSSMPGWSGTALTIQNVSGFFGSIIPLGIGLAASWWGLGRAMWLLLAAPIALLIGLRSMGGPPPAGDPVR